MGVKYKKPIDKYATMLYNKHCRKAKKPNGKNPTKGREQNAKAQQKPPEAAAVFERPQMNVVRRTYSSYTHATYLQE